MATAKDIILKPIKVKTANAFIKRYHYSGKVVKKSNLHIGVYLDGLLEGVMQFGSPLDKRKVLPLVSGTKWNEMLELNRLAFTDALPRNSESRALSIAFKLIKKHAPHIKWILSYADATQCGDGTIYRASGFVLTSIKKSFNLAMLPHGDVVHKMTLESNPTRRHSFLGGQSYYDVTGGTYNFRLFVDTLGGTILPGFQLRYIYFIDKSYRNNLTVPVLPFSAIGEAGAAMYLGEKRHADD